MNISRFVKNSAEFEILGVNRREADGPVHRHNPYRRSAAGVCWLLDEQLESRFAIRLADHSFHRGVEVESQFAA
jgi:hypothetical protein